MRRRFIALLLSAFAFPSLAFGQAPGPLTFVVPFQAGGGIDIFARLLGEEIGQSRGQAVVIENRPGASSMIGAEFVARAPPDGSVILISSNSTLIAPQLRKLPFDPLADLTPICALAESPQVIVVNEASPYRRLGDLMVAAKAKPGELTIGANGPASTQQIVAEMFKRSAGIDMTFVPYPGGAPAVNALLGGQISAIAANYSEVHSQIEAGQARALATTAAKRIPSLPDTPTAREEGVDFDVTSWHGAAAPAGTPPAIVADLTKSFLQALNSPRLQEKLAAAQYFRTGMCGAPFAEFLRQQSTTIGRISREAGIKLD